MNNASGSGRTPDRFLCAGRRRRAMMLFLYFLKIGWFTFGGGWSIVAQLQRDFVERRNCLSEEELLDLTSVGRSIPGVMICNVSFLFGYRFAGPLGAFLSICGMVIPSVCILSVITMCYLQFRANVYVSRALVGVRASVAPILLLSALKLRKGALKGWFTWGIALAALAMCLFTRVNQLLIVLIGAAAGLIFREIALRREAKRNGHP